VGEDLDENAAAAGCCHGQLSVGLAGVDPANVVVGYEPVWSIGPGRPVPDAAHIEESAALIKRTLRSP
jgi:triosephosphate isomerase